MPAPASECLPWAGLGTRSSVNSKESSRCEGALTEAVGCCQFPGQQSHQTGVLRTLTPGRRGLFSPIFLGTCLNKGETKNPWWLLRSFLGRRRAVLSSVSPVPECTHRHARTADGSKYGSLLLGGGRPTGAVLSRLLSTPHSQQSFVGHLRLSHCTHPGSPC